MNDPTPLTLDVRPILKAGGEPLAEIMRTVSGLAPGQALRLLATFEPIPLYAVLGRKGFAHTATQRGKDDWEILFAPDPRAEPQKRAPRPAAGTHNGDSSGWPAPSRSLDNRGLGPPEPMVRILSTLEELKPGEVLEAWNDREPLLLYPELEQRGAAITVKPEPEGVHLMIRRGG
ncbi:MAG: DUF2249 domain-containing protein [Acetobacteraceae bacterium]